MLVRGIHVYTVGQNRGTNRIWLENLALSDARFEPGTPVVVEYGQELVIRQCSEEEATQHVSSRKRGSREIPILDVSRGLDTLFTYKEKVRVEIREGEIRITKICSFSIMEPGEPAAVSQSAKFTIVEIPSGAGLAGVAFEDTGLYDVIAAGDLDVAALEALRYNQPKPLLYHANMFDLHQDDIPAADMLMFTVDCRSYARLGRRDYVSSATAPMVHHGLRMIAAKQFPVVLIENVVEFGKSIWYEHYKRIMAQLGYNITDNVLQAWDFGTIASRPRFISVAVRQPFTFEWPMPEFNKAHRDKVKKFVEPAESRKWMSITENRTLSFFFGKHQAEQKERGNGFGISENVLVSYQDTKIPAFISSYHKIQSSGPFLKHPTNPDLLSMFTPQEILNIQGFPEYEMPPWQSASTHYELIGQAICGRMFRALALSVATTLMEMKLSMQDTAKKVARRIRQTRGVYVPAVEQLVLPIG